MVLKLFFLALRLEIDIFMDEKGRIVSERRDEKWFGGLLLLCDISHYLNDLNTKIQGQQKLISDES
jgi:hypothetical protein